MNQLIPTPQWLVEELARIFAKKDARCGCTFSQRCPQHDAEIQRINREWIAKGRPGTK